MIVTETIFHEHCPVGLIAMETNTGELSFCPTDSNDPHLKEIAFKKWSCPVKLREAIIRQLERDDG